MTPLFGNYLRLPKYCGIIQNGATSASLGSFDIAMTDEINALILRLNQELKSVEQLATEGLNIAGNKLERSPNNARLIQLFAYLNNSILLVVFLRRRIEYSRLILATDTATSEQFQEAGEDLSEWLGQVLEAKVGVSRVKTRLENW